MLLLFLVPSRSQVIALRRSHNEGRRKQHEARLSRHRVVHIHVMKKKRRSAHAEGVLRFYVISKVILKC